MLYLKGITALPCNNPFIVEAINTSKIVINQPSKPVSTPTVITAMVSIMKVRPISKNRSWLNWKRATELCLGSNWKIRVIFVTFKAKEHFENFDHQVEFSYCELSIVVNYFSNMQKEFELMEIIENHLLNEFFLVGGIFCRLRRRGINFPFIKQKYKRFCFSLNIKMQTRTCCFFSFPTNQITNNIFSNYTNIKKIYVILFIFSSLF